jgi:hypothetical protein
MTKNLEIALRQLRVEDKPRPIWIDALSISENNVNERNQRVSQMGGI